MVQDILTKIHFLAEEKFQKIYSDEGEAIFYIY